MEKIIIPEVLLATIIDIVRDKVGAAAFTTRELNTVKVTASNVRTC